MAFFRSGFIRPHSFPVVAGSVASTGGGAPANSHVASLPAGIQSGDLLLLLVNWSGAPGTVTISGWTNIGSDTYRKIANGSEGATVLVETSNSVLPGGFNAYRILGSTGDVEVSGEPGSNTLDPPPLAPSWGSQKTLWIARLKGSRSGNWDITAYPNTYAGGVQSKMTGIGITWLNASAWRQLEAAEENPGSFSVSASPGFARPLTIAVKPT